MKRIVGFVLLLAVAGCAGVGGIGGPNMGTPEQLTALAKDRQTGVSCLTITGAGGTGSLILVNDDKGVIAAGSVTVMPNCQTTITHLPKEVKAP